MSKKVNTPSVVHLMKVDGRFSAQLTKKLQIFQISASDNDLA
jgi:hypothetical protein